MNYNFHHLGICTNNPQQLIKFYEEKMGFEKGETRIVPRDLMEHFFKIPDACSLTKLMFGQIILEIISPQSLMLKKRANDVSGYNHWSLGVKKKKEFCQKLKERGVPILEKEREGHIFYFVKDPEGNLIEIYESP